MSNNINLELLLRDLYESMTELSITLDKEHTALSDNDLEALQASTLSKEDLSEKVQQLDNQRKMILDSLGLENNLEGMTQLIRRFSEKDEDALSKLWNMVSELAQDCAAKNKLIGIIIEAKRRQTNAALSILQGYQEDDSKLYDAEGSSVQISTNNSIARA